ncbi:MAG TPA: homocysteine S-methyltransferase family protein, partial [Holophagaceae bacterium]|nr:homocysteine S-methyltransferase family protein [Holophagaceae bacterium]
MSIPFRQALDDGRCCLFDGSTPTALYERGTHFNRSFDGENLANPGVVKGVHEAFRAAGAQVLTTNTWAANRAKLSAYGLGEKLIDINRRGAELAREALGSSIGDGWVAGCIGPLGLRIEPWGPTSFDEARTIFTEQAEALLSGGVDLFVLEAFEDLNEIRQAIAAVKAVSDLPVVAMMTPGDGGCTLYGAEPEWYAQKLAEWGADILGANGGGGPAQLLALLKRFRAATSIPLILKPSAGLPRQVDGRVLYPSSPEYLGEFARQALQGGARA